MTITYFFMLVFVFWVLIRLNILFYLIAYRLGMERFPFTDAGLGVAFCLLGLYFFHNMQ